MRVRASSSVITATVPRRSGQPRSAGSRTDSQSGTDPEASADRKAPRRDDGTTTTGCGSSPRAGTTNQPSPVAAAADVSARRDVVRAWAGVTPAAPVVSGRSPSGPGRRPCSTRRGASGSARRATAVRKVSTHCRASTSPSQRCERSSAAAPMRLRRSSSVAIRSIAAARAALDAGGTRSPSTSWVIISRGPDGQSYDTGGTPADIASCRTSG